MDGQRLQPQLRRPDADRPALGDRFGRRRMFAVGLGRSSRRRRPARCRRASAGSSRRASSRAPARPADAAGPGAAQRRLPGRAAGHRARDLRRRDRTGGRRRPGRRRRDRPGPVLGVDLLAERPDRAGRRSRSCCGGSRRAAAPRPALDLAAWPSSPAARSGRVGPGTRQRGRLGQPRGRRVAGGRACCWRGVRGLGAARAGSRCCRWASSAARLLRRQRGGVLPVRVAVRGAVLPRPVPADRAGVLPARGRAAAGAVDRHPDVGGADRRRAGRPVGERPSSSPACCCRRSGWAGSR